LPGRIAAKDMRTMDSDEYPDEVAVQPARLRAAEYVRMSTEHQQYSTENQGDNIQLR
jgi:hypothetical protein